MTQSIAKTPRESNGRQASRTRPFGTPGNLSEFFDTFFSDLPDAQPTSYIPAVNIGENRDKYFIEISAPGYAKADLKISVDNGNLVISAEKQSEDKSEDKSYSRREFSYSSFRRSFPLPDTVDSEKISSTYRDGILSVDLPKREEAKPKPPRQIDIR